MTEADIKDKKSYEISYLIKEESDAGEVLRLLKQYEAEVTEESSPKRFLLAYPIKGETAALFGYVQFTASPENMPALDKNLKTNSRIIRFLLTTPPIEKEKIISPRPVSPATSPTKPESTKSTLPLSNEALERKIEEILQ